MKLRETKRRQGRVRRMFSNVVFAIALGIIAILAVPTTLLIGMIFLVWSAGDRIIKAFCS